MAIISFALLVIVFIFFWKRIVHFMRIWYISLVYGRYSYEFLSFFKENSIRSPYNGCVKDEITMHFVVFYRKIKNAKEFQTNTAIDYGKIPFMTSCKKLLKIKGAPDCMKVAALNDIKFVVMGYNETLQGLKMKSMYFFLNDHFVMGEFMFINHLRSKPANLAGILSSKYLDGNPIENDVFYITDSKGNQLNYEHNGFSISMKYLFRGDHTLNMILSGLFTAGDNQSDKYLNMLKNEELLDRF